VDDKGLRECDLGLFLSYIYIYRPLSTRSIPGLFSNVWVCGCTGVGASVCVRVCVCTARKFSPLFIPHVVAAGLVSNVCVCGCVCVCVYVCVWVCVNVYTCVCG